MSTMKAVVLHAPGGPEALRIEARPVPEPVAGRVLVRVRAFGLNRSELFTRQGLSPDVQLPRVLGIEAVGTVAACPGGEFAEGTTVATVMGGMGRRFDGGYAEYASVPVEQVQAVSSTLPWETLGALPEMLQTAHGSLYHALRLTPGERLLIRGGTTSVGLAAAAIAKRGGALVAATTRNPDREPLLKRGGADQVFIDTGSISEQVRDVSSGGVDKVLELVGTTTMLDSLRCARPHGVVCMTGLVGDRWWFDRLSPMDAIPTAVRLTTYDGGVEDFMRTPLQELVDEIAAGRFHVPVGPVFRLDDIVEAHRCMESNRAGGKIVVLT